MIWRYFPIGLRFPVKDFSDETKRTCWQTALSALCASGACGATLYDAQETYDCGTGGPVYTCIACMEDIKRSRAVGKYLYSLDALMAGLCMHRPFVQANYLESFGPYPLLGKAAEEGASEITDAGRTFLPEYVAPMQASDGLRLLIAADSINADIPARRRELRRDTDHAVLAQNRHRRRVADVAEIRCKRRWQMRLDIC